MVLSTLLLRKASFHIKIERQHRNLKKKTYQVERWTNSKKYLSKAKRSKKDYLKTTQRIKAQVGEQPCLKIEQSLHLLESSNKEGTF